MRSAALGSQPLAIVGDRHAAPAPILHLNFLEHHPGPVERFAKHVQQHLAHAFEDRSLLFRGDAIPTGFGALAGELDGDDRHWSISLISMTGTLTAIDVE